MFNFDIMKSCNKKKLGFVKLNSDSNKQNKVFIVEITCNRIKTFCNYGKMRIFYKFGKLSQGENDSVITQLTKIREKDRQY